MDKSDDPYEPMNGALFEVQEKPQTRYAWKYIKQDMIRVWGEKIRKLKPDARFICTNCDKPAEEHAILVGAGQVICPNGWVIFNSQESVHDIYTDKEFNEKFLRKGLKPLCNQCTGCRGCQ